MRIKIKDISFEKIVLENQIIFEQDRMKLIANANEQLFGLRQLESMPFTRKELLKYEKNFSSSLEIEYIGLTERQVESNEENYDDMPALEEDNGELSIQDPTSTESMPIISLTTNEYLHGSEYYSRMKLAIEAELAEKALSKGLHVVLRCRAGQQNVELAEQLESHEENYDNMPALEEDNDEPVISENQNINLSESQVSSKLADFNKQLEELRSGNTDVSLQESELIKMVEAQEYFDHTGCAISFFYNERSKQFEDLCDVD